MFAITRLAIVLSAAKDTRPPDVPVVNMSFPIISMLLTIEVMEIPAPVPTRMYVFIMEMCALIPDEKPAPDPEVERKTSRTENFESAVQDPVSASGVFVSAVLILVFSISASALKLADDFTERKLFVMLHFVNNNRK